MKLKYILLIIIIPCILIAQTEDDIYLNMSLEEMFNLDVVISASKKPEDIFEAPLSIDIIKKEDILNAGITNIPEALRLAPGLIVREQTPGNFDIHIRGYDNVMTNLMTPLPTNSVILVMINNRVVYNYFSGGTFWETLPIGINDIERIEIVRGPASALYGPNAATGVIHFITSKPEFDKISSNILFASNGLDYKNGNININYLFDNNKYFTINSNYQSKKRNNKTYFDWKTNRYIPFDSLNSIFLFDNNEYLKLIELDEVKIPEHENSLENIGINSSFSYEIQDDYIIQLDLGTQQSQAIKSYYNNFSTPLSEYKSKTSYFNFNGQFDDFYSQVSYTSGRHNNNCSWNNYNFEHFDASLEFDYEKKNFNIRPGISYREASYKGELLNPSSMNFDDYYSKKYYDNKTIHSTAFSILTNYHITKELRLIGGYRLDKYNLSNEISNTYETGFTYRLDKNNLFRFVHSRANRSPFMIDTYIDQGIVTGIEIPELNKPQPVYMHFKGNKDIHHLTNQLIEFGWRFKYSTKLYFDVEIFTSVLDNFIDLSVEEDSIHIIENLGILYIPITFKGTEKIKINQKGLSFSFNYKYYLNNHIRFFGTYQKTEFNIEENDKNKNNPNNPEIDEEGTPKYYGGLSLDFSPTKKLQLNCNLYYISKHSYESILLEEDENEIFKVKGFTILNLTLQYKIHEQLSLFVSGRNLLGKHIEYGFTDEIEPSFWIGLKADFHK